MAIQEAVDFRWTFPADGFHWTKAAFAGRADQTTMVLVDDAKPQSTVMVKRTFPLRDHPGLFRDFAALSPTEGAILTFANQHGNLGVGERLHRSLSLGESLASWAFHVGEMQFAVNLADLVRLRDSKGLARLLKHEEDGWWWKKGTEGGRIEPSPEIEFRAGDLFLPATFLLNRWANRHLTKHSSARLLYDPEQAKEVLRIVPDNLIAAMWLQLAEAVAGRKTLKECKVCGKWMEVTRTHDPRGATVRRVFCSDKCKVQDYRKRKAQAGKETPKKRKA